MYNIYFTSLLTTDRFFKNQTLLRLKLKFLGTNLFEYH